jgi:hypothetical protein
MAQVEGFYAFTFIGIGSGMGALLISGNKIIGFDVLKVKYDGTYTQDGEGNVLAEIRMTVPPGVPLVIGIPPQAKEYTIDFIADLPSNFGTGIPVVLGISGRPVQVSFTKMRDL